MTSLSQALFAFLLVVVLIPVALVALRRFRFLRPGARQVMRVTAGLALGPRERLAVVEVGGRWLVLGVTTQAISLLATLDEPPAELVASPVPGSLVPGNPDPAGPVAAGSVHGAPGAASQVHGCAIHGVPDPASHVHGGAAHDGPGAATASSLAPATRRPTGASFSRLLAAARGRPAGSAGG